MKISQHVRAIASFVEAADTGNFTAAAKKLSISPAAVSKNIASLEQALDVRLMNRTTRKVNLTEEGEAFLSHARSALDTLENAVDSLVATKQEISGHVRISTSAAIGKECLLPVLPELLNRYPHLSVDVDFDDRVTDLVRDGYDIAIRGGHIVDSSLITRPVSHLSTLLVASPHYLAQNGAPESPDALCEHRLIARRFLGGRVNVWRFLNQDGSIINFEPTPAVLTLSAPEASLQAALSGVGIAQVAMHNAIEYLERGELHIVLASHYDSGSFELVIQYPHRALIAPRVRVTIDYLLEAFKQDKNLHYPLSQLSQYQYSA